MTDSTFPDSHAVTAAASAGAVAFVAVGNRLSALRAGEPPSGEGTLIGRADEPPVEVKGLLVHRDLLLALIEHGPRPINAGPRAELVVFDIARPMQPRRIGEVDLRIGGAEAASVVDMDVFERQVLITATDNILRRVDLADSAAPALLPALDTAPGFARSGWPPNLAVVGQSAYLTSETSLIVVDLSTAGAPRLVQPIALPNGPWEKTHSLDPFDYTVDVAAVDGLLLVTDRERDVWLIDPARPAEPATSLGNLPVEEPRVAQMSGRRVSLVGRSRPTPGEGSAEWRLVELDFTNPTAPRWSMPRSMPKGSSPFIVRLDGALWTPARDGSRLVEVAP